jgi:centromere/kinetochore protein ZW10
MADTPDPKKLSDALLAFALDGQFPDDIASLPLVSGTDLEPAIQALDKAKQDLEVRQAKYHDMISQGLY